MSTTHRRRRSYALLVTAVVAVAIALRLLPLHWTSYPFNPDGFVFAGLARDLLTNAAIPDRITSQQVAFTLVMAMTAELLGVDPLWIGQPIIALVGAGPPILAVAFTRRIARSRGWPARQTAVAMVVAGLVLATNGVFLRRTAGVHYETFGLLLVPVLALIVHRWFESRRLVWAGAAAPVLVVFPLTHHLSSVVGGVALVLVCALWCHRRLDWQTIAAAFVLAGGFWMYIGTYYVLTGAPLLDRLATNRGLFVAWLVVAVALTLWFRTTSVRTARLAVGSVFTIGFGVTFLNAFGLYPGFSATSPTLVALLTPLLAFAGFCVVGIHYAMADADVAPVVLALLVAPVTMVLFSLTAGLSPEYADTARRSQTFVHLAVMVMATVSAVGWSTRLVDRARWRRLDTAVRTGLPVLLVVCALVTTPIAFADLHVSAFKGTTSGEEFGAATFAVEHVPGTWAGDDHTTRIAGNYYPARTNASVAPVYGWLHGDPPPGCPTMAQHDWTTVGAQLFPDDPVQLERGVYERWQTERNVVYATSGPDTVVLVHPTAASAGC